MLYKAARGERNDVAVSEVYDPPLTVGVTELGYAVTISDAGAIISPGASCEALDEHTARCSLAGAVSVHFALGDGNDRLLARGSEQFGPAAIDVVANGGSGDDVLDLRGSGVSGFGYGELNGGGGRDQLYGGPFGDLLIDGDRDNASGDARPGPDVLDGGDGPDVVSYHLRTNPVVVDLAGGRPAGERGEGDIVRGVESVVGGSARDWLAGTNHRNSILGGGGRDTLIGRGGSDGFGEVPVDRDRVPYASATGTAGDDVSCGRGSDDDWDPSSNTYAKQCERMWVHRSLFGSHSSFGWPVAAHPRRVGSSLRYSIQCVYPNDLDNPQWARVRCSGTVTAREAATPKRLLAIGRIPRSRRGQLKLTTQLRLTALGQRVAARRRPARALMQISGMNLPTASWTIRLKLPR